MFDKSQGIRAPDLQKVEAALRRASQKAKELAERTGTEFVVVNGSQNKSNIDETTEG